MKEGRPEEGLDLLRNALAASSLREDEDDTYMELEVLVQLIDALFWTHAFDEVEPLILRFRKAAEAKSLQDERVSSPFATGSWRASTPARDFMRLGTPPHPASFPPAMADSVLSLIHI